MDEAKKYRLKAFVWDQFIRPFKLVFNMYQLQILLLVVVVISVILKLNGLFWFSMILTFILVFYDLYKYYKSGKFMENYRNEKYPDYRKAIKAKRRAEKINSHIEQPLAEIMTQSQGRSETQVDGADSDYLGSSKTNFPPNQLEKKEELS